MPLSRALSGNCQGISECLESGYPGWNQQLAGWAVVKRTSTISLGMLTSVPDNSSSSTTAANDSISLSLTLLVSSLTRKEELVGDHNNNPYDVHDLATIHVLQTTTDDTSCPRLDLTVGQ